MKLYVPFVRFDRFDRTEKKKVTTHRRVLTSRISALEPFRSVSKCIYSERLSLSLCPMTV